MQAPVGSEHPGSTSRHHLLRTNGCKTAKGIKWFCGCWRGRTARNPANCIRFLNHLHCWLMLKWRRVMSSTMTNIHKRSLELPKKEIQFLPRLYFPQSSPRWWDGRSECSSPKYRVLMRLLLPTQTGRFSHLHHVIFAFIITEFVQSSRKGAKEMVALGTQPVLSFFLVMHPVSYFHCAIPYSTLRSGVSLWTYRCRQQRQVGKKQHSKQRYKH